MQKTTHAPSCHCVFHVGAQLFLYLSVRQHLWVKAKDTSSACLWQRFLLSVTKEVLEKTQRQSSAALHAHTHEVRPPRFTLFLFQPVGGMNGVMNFKTLGWWWMLLFFMKAWQENLFRQSLRRCTVRLWRPWRSSHLWGSLGKAKNQGCKECRRYNSHFILKSEKKPAVFARVLNGERWWGFLLSKVRHQRHGATEPLSKPYLPHSRSIRLPISLWASNAALCRWAMSVEGHNNTSIVLLCVSECVFSTFTLNIHISIS